jgi:hypothetical protein
MNSSQDIVITAELHMKYQAMLRLQDIISSPQVTSRGDYKVGVDLWQARIVGQSN